MPLLYTKNTPTGMLGVWDIRESVSILEKMYAPKSAELKKYQSIITTAKKQQWLAVRVLMELLDKDASISYDNYNRPLLDRSANHISISHTNRYAAVLIDSENPAGIDIEKVSDKVVNISGKFMSSEEMNSISDQDKLSHLTLFWCAKEAVYKLHGKKELLFKEHIKVQPFEYGQNGNINVHLINDITDKFYKSSCVIGCNATGHIA